MQHFVQSIRTTVIKPILDLSPNRPFCVSLPACHEHKNYCTSSTLTFTRVAHLLEQQQKSQTNLSIFISTKFVKHRYAGEEKNNPRGNPCTRRPQKTAIKRAAKGPGLEKLQRNCFIFWRGPQQSIQGNGSFMGYSQHWNPIVQCPVCALLRD